MKKRRLTANWGLKLASLIFAAVLWFLVTNINDPVVTVRFGNVPVTLKNTDTITDAGDVYQVLDNTDVIGTVTILAPRSIADSFSKDNIVAVADLDNLTTRNTANIQLSVNKYSNEIDNISGSIDTVKLNIEKKKTATLPLVATTSGTLSDGYIIGDVSTEQNMIRITGPQSVIAKVAKAAVDVDVTGFTSNIGTDADIRLYDADGREVSDSSIQMNIKSVRVNVEILQAKYVELHYNTTGTPASGYMLTGVIDSTPDKVLIAGKSTALESIDTLEITDDQLNVSGLRDDLEASVDLEKYLPSGISFGDSDFSGVASVVVHIEPIETAKIQVPVSQITPENVPDGYSVSVRDLSGDAGGTVSVEIQGLAAEIAKVSAADITGSIDMNDVISGMDNQKIKEGTYQADATLVLPDQVKADNKVKVQLEVSGNANASDTASVESSAGN